MKKLNPLILLLLFSVQFCFSQPDYYSKRPEREYKRISESAQRAYSVPASSYNNNSTYKSTVNSSYSNSNSSSSSTSTNNYNTTSTPESTGNSWVNTGQINRRNAESARYNAWLDATKLAYENKLARLEKLIIERNISKSKENYQAIFNCALDAGFDNYSAGRHVGFNANEYQAMLDRQAASNSNQSPQSNNLLSTNPNVNGNFSGYGTKKYNHGTYTGDLVSGVQQGKGRMTYNSGDYYEGSIRQNDYEGFGTFKWTNGDEYVGNFLASKRHGTGILRFANGDVYEGNFLQDIKDGYAKYTWKNGVKYEGYYKNNVINGEGKITKINGAYMQGTFENNAAKIVKYYNASGTETSLKEYQLDAMSNSNNVGSYFSTIAKNMGMVSTSSGLKYIVLKKGTGATPNGTATVKVSYQGRLSNGTVFDSSNDYGGSIEVTLNAVIPGWSEALQIMSVGSQYQLLIPSNLAFGAKGIANKVKPNESVIYTITLLEIK